MDLKQIQANLTTDKVGRNLEYQPSVDSTNEWAKRSAEFDFADGITFLTEAQTLGRGRQGRRWVSPPGKGIYLSILLKPDGVGPNLSQITILSGVAVFHAIHRAAGLWVKLKYPNDIVFNERKLGGILAETRLEGERAKYLIVGIGINDSFQEWDFPEEIRDGSTSILMERGFSVERNLLIAEILNKFEGYYRVNGREGFSKILGEWKQLTNTLGRIVRVERQGETILGTAEGVDEEGYLRVRTSWGMVSRIGLGDEVQFLT